MADISIKTPQFVKGLARGLTADIVGGPVDLATVLVNSGLAGYGYLGNKLGFLKPNEMPDLIERPIGGSDWFAGRNTPLTDDGSLGFTAGRVSTMALPALNKGLSKIPLQRDSSLGTFIGPKGKNFPYDKLKEAKALEASGADEKKIFLNTGLSKGAEGIWRKELDDSQLRFRNGGVDYLDMPPEVARLPFDEMQAAMSERRNQPLLSVLQHPELQANYPQLGKIQSELYKRPSWLDEMSPSGSYNGVSKRLEATFSNEAQARDVILHEIQHGIQGFEGMAPGGSPVTVRKAIQEAFGKGIPEYNALKLRELADFYKGDPEKFAKIPGFNASSEEVAMARAMSRDILRERLDQRLGIDKLDDFQLYKRLAGEVESRNVETRRLMSPADRANIPPWETAEFPISKQIALPASKYAEARSVEKPDLYRLRQGLAGKMAQKTGDIQTQIAMRDWAFTPGATLLSKTSGQTVMLKGKYMQKGEPVYFAEFQNPKTGESYTGTVKESFLTDSSRFLPLDQQPADLASVNSLLRGLAGKK